MGFILWAAPLIAALAAFISKDRKAQHGISIGSAAVIATGAIFATARVIRDGVLGYGLFGGIFYIDAVSVIMLDIVAVISLLVSVYSSGYLENEHAAGQMTDRQVKIYYMLMDGFMFSMILALTVNNIGVLWISIEATTLASAFLVGFHNDKHSLEAAWKYVIICSVGIALALMGIIFLNLSSVGVIGKDQALQWPALFEAAAGLNTDILRFAFIFMLVGFGTKAGLAPMHTWLPDAHSQAPSPVSALLSGVLLNSAMYGIIRTAAIVNKSLGDSLFTGRIMIGFGILSVVTAAVFILTQRDYKRLLAYSSIEHMGIVAIAFGVFTPLSMFAGFFHMINHSLTKSMLFLASGNILQKYETREISGVKSLLKVMPATGAAFLLGLFAISGTPPFSVFASEFNVMASIFAEGRFMLGALFVILLAFIFAGIAVTLFRIFHEDEVNGGEIAATTNKQGTAAILVLLAAIAVMGIYMPDQLKQLITSASSIIGGGAR